MICPFYGIEPYSASVKDLVFYHRFFNIIVLRRTPFMKLLVRTPLIHGLVPPPEVCLIGPPKECGVLQMPQCLGVLLEWGPNITMQGAYLVIPKLFKMVKFWEDISNGRLILWRQLIRFQCANSFLDVLPLDAVLSINVLFVPLLVLAILKSGTKLLLYGIKLLIL